MTKNEIELHPLFKIQDDEIVLNDLYNIVLLECSIDLNGCIDYDMYLDILNDIFDGDDFIIMLYEGSIDWRDMDDETDTRNISMRIINHNSWLNNEQLDVIVSNFGLNRKLAINLLIKFKDKESIILAKTLGLFQIE